MQLEREHLPRYLAHKLSPHQIDLKEVLALAELRGTLPAETVAIGAEPGEVVLSTALTGVAGGRRGAGAARGRGPPGQLGASNAAAGWCRSVHELSLALEVCRIAELHAEPHGAHAVRAVAVEIGDDAGIEVDNFRFCLEALLAQPPFAGARLELHSRQGRRSPGELPGGG